MEQPELGNTIANLRKQKGLTQEELALRCGINVKSVESLESGSVISRSATIKLLAEELDFEFNDEIDDDSKFWLITLHLSNFFCIVVIPLVIWAWKKDEDPEIDKQGKDVINFQLSMTIYLFASSILVFVLVGILFLLALGGYITIITIINTIKVMTDNDYKYPMTIKFIK